MLLSVGGGLQGILKVTLGLGGDRVTEGCTFPRKQVHAYLYVGQKQTTL
jgi:hypothetical protein